MVRATDADRVHGPDAKRLQEAFETTWHYLLRNGPLRRAEYRHNIECLTDNSEANELAVLASPTV